MSELNYSNNELIIQVQNGLALTKRRLNIPGYRIGVTQQGGEGKNAIELRLTPKKKVGNQ